MRTLRLTLLSLFIGFLITPLTVSAAPEVVRSETNSSLNVVPSNLLQNACPGNRLVNGGFEGGFSDRGSGEISVAEGWHPWFKPGSEEFPGLNYRPEYKPEDAQVHSDRRVHSGRFAQKWFTTFSTHTAGILQQVSGIPVGTRLNLSAWVQVWSDDTDDPNKSDVPGNYRVFIGIDPFGGTDWNSDNIVWSDPNMFAYDAHKQLTLSTTARNNVVTVFLKGVPEFPVKHNDSYWDDVCLQAIVPTNTPAPPTSTPIPTDTPTITPTPTDTLTPTSSVTPTNTATLTRTPTNTLTPTHTLTVTPLPTATITPTPTPPSTLDHLTNQATNNGTSGLVLLLGTAGVFILLYAASLRPRG